ncbi:MAG: hypothetical protein IKS55_07025 [Oscillospiraceae bacterium]|nr:hypothetical protein [Oscillospiraceae bacterium]
MSRTQKMTYGIASLILALFRSWSLYFYQAEQTKALGMAGSLVLLALRSVFYAFLFFILFFLMQECFINRRFAGKLFDDDPPVASPGKLFLFWCVALALGWLPHLILKYPGAVCWDSWKMLSQYHAQAITNFHSPFYAVLFGLFTDPFVKIGRGEIGLFLFAVFHFLIYVLVFGYSLWLLRVRMKAKRSVCLVVLICCLICPYLIGYFGVIIKDTLYCVSVFLFLLCLLDDSFDRCAFEHSAGKILLLIVSMVGTYLFRRNGIFILGAVWFCLLLQTLIKKKNRRLSVIVTLGLASAIVSSSVINTVWHVQDAGSRDAFSVCFQQTARYVKNYKDEIPEEEADIIRVILPYDELPELYDPRIADPVKNSYVPSGMEALKDWLKLWAKWFLRHPGCYFAAVMEQNYYLFTPEVQDNICYYRDVDVGYEISKKVVVSESTRYFEPIFHEPEALRGVKEAAVREYTFLHYLPVTRWLGNLSFWFYLLVFFAAFAAANRIPWLIFFLPGIVTVGVVIISPMIFGHPRYMFPVVYTMPVLIVYVLHAAAEKFPGKENP